MTLPIQVCRLLRIDRTTKLDVAWDEDRLIVRPVSRADRTGQPERGRMERVLGSLCKRGFTAAEFSRVSHDGTPLRTFVLDLRVGGYLDLVTVARLDECLARRRNLERTNETESWDDTIDAALARFPDRPGQRPPRRPYRTPQ